LTKYFKKFGHEKYLEDPKKAQMEKAYDACVARLMAKGMTREEIESSAEGRAAAAALAKKKEEEERPVVLSGREYHYTRAGIEVEEDPLNPNTSIGNK